MKNTVERIGKLMSQRAFAEMAANGTAPGLSNRARTMQSKRDKSRCPKRQRQKWRQEIGN